MFYITVSNGILTPEHKQRMGSAVWEFMWCIDKITKVDDKGMGYVLGGKPIKLHEIGMGHDNTTSRNLAKLEEEGYITTLRTPYGIVIKVKKAKKRFTKKSESLEPVNHQKWESPTENGESPTNNGESNKTVSVDSTEDITVAAQSAAKLVVEVIDLFKPVNPSYSKFFANKTQRAAVQRLLDIHGFDRLQHVIGYLPKSNGVPYLPVITTPAQLEDKWSALEAGLLKEKAKLTSKSKGYIL